MADEHKPKDRLIMANALDPKERLIASVQELERKKRMALSEKALERSERLVKGARDSIERAKQARDASRRLRDELRARQRHNLR